MDETQADLRQYIRILRMRKWEVAGVALAVIAVTMFFTFRQTPVYQGTAEVLVEPIQNPLNPYTAPIAPSLETERQLVESQAVASKVKQATHTALSSQELLDHLSVDVLTDTEVLAIHYDSTNPAAAASMANAFATQYIKYRTQQAVSRLGAAADSVKSQIDATQNKLRQLNGQIARLTRRTQPSASNPSPTPDTNLLNALQSERTSLIGRLGVLEQQYLGLVPNSAVQQSAGEIVQRAAVPTAPARPQKARNGALALLAGLGLGVGSAFLRERLDDRVKSREEVERRLGAPVFASVPKVSQWRRADDAYLVLRSDPKNLVAEAYRTLATNVQYVASQRSLRVIMVTSALGGEGKSTTSANLAVALAQTGKRVVLVSADLRKARIHRFFNLPNDVGLSDYLSANPRLAVVTQQTTIKNFRIITSGPVPENPSGLLGGSRWQELVESLRNVADFVVVDTPPVLAVADASVIAPVVDGVIYVMDGSKSGRAALAQARDQLHNAGASVIGIVYNNFDPAKARGYGYYSYYAEYYATDAVTGARTNAGGRRPGRGANRSDDFGFNPDAGDRFNGQAEGGAASKDVVLPASGAMWDSPAEPAET